MTTFPYPDVLRLLTESAEEKARRGKTDVERLVTASGAVLNWVGDMMSDPDWVWERRMVDITELTLTGTNPVMNEIIINRAQRSPKLLKEIIDREPETRALFAAATWREDPILVRREGEKLKIFDGMHRTIAAIRDGRTTIDVIIGTPPDRPLPMCEPHVVYDLLRPWLQQRTNDRAGLIAALRYLRAAYRNVDELLRQRFSIDWVNDPELQNIIQESLGD